MKDVLESGDLEYGQTPFGKKIVPERNLNNSTGSGTFLVPDPHQQGLRGSIAEDAVGCSDIHFGVNTSSAMALSEACRTTQWSF